MEVRSSGLDVINERLKGCVNLSGIGVLINVGNSKGFCGLWQTFRRDVREYFVCKRRWRVKGLLLHGKAVVFGDKLVKVNGGI